MSLTLSLGTHGEELVAAQLRTGRYQSAEHVVTRALEALAETETPGQNRKKTTAEAVAHIRASRKGIRLDGLRIADLIHEGHRY